MLPSIRWRISAPFVLLILVVMIGLGIYISDFIHKTYIENLERHLYTNTRLMGNSLESLLSQSDQIDLEEIAKRWGDQLNLRVTIIARDGIVLGDSFEDPRKMDNHINRPEVEQALKNGQGISTRFSQTVGYETMYSAVPIYVKGQIFGVVRSSLTLREIQEDINHLQKALLGTTILATVLAVIIATVIADRTTRPLHQLTEAVTDMSRADFPYPKLLSNLPPASTDEVGRLTQAFTVLSQQLHAQIEKLEGERKKNIAVLQEMTDGVLIVDESGYVQLINPAVMRMLNIQIRKPLGRSMIELLRHHQFTELWQQARESGTMQSSSFEIGPQRIYIQCMATPLDQILPGSTLLLLQNLTRQRHLENVRRDFISNISHELRTPLASLKALTETLQEGALNDPSVAGRFLKQIEVEVDSLSHMVTELLELSRIESGQVPLRLISIKPLDLLDDAVDRLKLQADRSGLRINIDCSDDLPAILADPPRLEQVVVNLLHNAIKFTPPGGSINLKAIPDHNMMIFSVQDTGVGIKPDDLVRIFERFYKVDRARATGGTGLGLAIARHMVEAHGGKIWAESEENKGSTFYFSIPQA